MLISPLRATDSFVFPFVGRKTEFEAILKFSEKAVEDGSLRLMWIAGEAGIGKSSLIQKVSRQLRSSGKSVITLVCYPETTNSILSLLSDRIETDPTISRIVGHDIERSAASILGTLRRIIRLRPTIIILEDVHLLNEKEASDVLTLIQNLSHEPVGILCTARSVQTDVYPLLRPWLKSTIELTSLDKKEVEEMVENLQTINTADKDLLANLLFTSTQGHPLIIRSILPGLLNAANAVPHNLEFIQVQTHLEATESIRGLVANFTYGLTEEEKNAARRLATLGEVFSKETATLLPNGKELLRTLEDHQVIRRSTRPLRPLFGAPEKEMPYLFAHSLLHQQLLSEVSETSDPIVEDHLVRIVAQGKVLYSRVPIQQLSLGPIPFAEPEVFGQFFNKLLDGLLFLSIDTLLQYSLIDRLWNDAQSIYRNHIHLLAEEKQRIMELRLLNIRLRMLTPLMFHPEQDRYRAEYLRLTENPTELEVARHRTLALNQYFWYASITHISPNIEYIHEVPALMERFPELIGNKESLGLIGFLVSMAPLHGKELVEIAQRMFASVCEKCENDLSLRSALCFVGFRIVGAIRNYAGTKEAVAELEAFAASLRKRLIDETRTFDLHRYYGSQSITWAFTDPMKCVEMIRRYLPNTSPNSELGYSLRWSMSVAEFALGIPQEIIVRNARHFLHEFAESAPGNGSSAQLMEQPMLAQWTRTGGVLSGEIDAGTEVALLLCKGNQAVIENHMKPFVAGLNGDIPTLREYYDEGKRELDLFRLSIACCVDASNDVEGAASELQAVLDAGAASAVGLLYLRIAVRLAEVISSRGDQTSSFVEQLKEPICRAIRNGLTWCADKEAYGYGAPLLKLAEHYLPPAQYKKWEKRIAEGREEACKKSGFAEFFQPIEKDNRPSLSVIGSIEVVQPDGTIQRFQGARVRRVAAIIVANQLMSTPLSLSEFRQVATDMPPDAERIGNYTRTLLWRIRSVLGPDSIIADGEEPPRFDTNHLRVDLLDVIDCLEQAEEGVRAARPRPARKALLRGLSIIGDGPLYPTLYDEFFEAARLDFEVRLRNGIRATVALLRREGDIEEAERLLRTAQRAMPGDEEMIEELIDVLQLLGRNAEAVALRQKMMQEIGGGR